MRGLMMSIIHCKNINHEDNNILIGNIDYPKAQKAVELSMEKYCSVSRILEKTANINYSFEVKSGKSHNKLV